MVANWELIGMEDGTRGQDTDYVGNHRKACSEFGIVPDLAEYRKGYNEGLIRYCDQYNGFKQGEQGAEYQGVCPANLEPDFLIGYHKGREIYQLNTRINQAKSSINANEQEIEKLDEDINDLENKLISDSSTSEARRELLDDLKLKQEQRVTLDNENHVLVIEAARLEGELKGKGYGVR
jgi:hypothetical protein